MMKFAAFGFLLGLLLAAAMLDATAYAGEMSCRARWKDTGYAYQYRGVVPGCMVLMPSGQWVDGDERLKLRMGRISSGKVTP